MKKIKKRVRKDENQMGKRTQNKRESNNFKDTLREAKQRITTQSQHSAFGGSKQQVAKYPTEETPSGLIKVAIDDTFTADRFNPLTVANWQIWKNHKNKIIVRPVNMDTGKYYVYNYEEGTLFIVDRANTKYTYFRGKRFQEFLEKYGINKVRRQEPNGEYQGRHGTFQDKVNWCALVTDGTQSQSGRSTIGDDKQPVIDVSYASVFFQVQNANFVIFEQQTMRKDEDGKMEMLHHTRQLVTNGDIFKLENEIANAIKSFNESSSMLSSGTNN